MSGKRQNTARTEKRWVKSIVDLRGKAGAVAAAALAVMVVGAVVAAIAILSSHAGAGRAGAHANGSPDVAAALTPTATSAATCGTASAPTCPTQTSDWLPLATDTPAAVLAIFKQSGLYTAVQNSNTTGQGDAQFDLSRPETPVFERELHVSGGLVVPDVYIVPFDLASGAIGYFAICNLNATHTAIEVGEIVPAGTVNGQPRPHGQLTPIAANVALSAVHTQRSVSLRPGAQPALVFVVVDATLIETGQSKWSGPAGPQNPFWLIPGADGQDYLVDTAGKVYLPSQLPIEMAAPTP